HVTLALTVFHPWLLAAGTAMASIPVIIHLLNRLRFKRVVWAAMEFLLAAHRKNARRIRIEQIILLVIRTLIILLLAAALARPVLTGLLGQFGRSATHAIIVMDDSFSMSSQHRGNVEGGSIMLEARQAAARLVEGFDQRDGVSLVLAGSQPHGRITAASYDHPYVLEQIESLRASDSATDMIGALEVAKKIIDESELEQKTVYVFTDNTAVAWTDDAAGTLAKLVAAIAEKATLTVVDFGQPESSNVVVRSLRPDKSVVTTGIDSLFRIEVENFSDQPAADVVVNMAVDGQRLAPVVVGEVPPRKVETRSWSWNFTEPGGHTVAASLREQPGDDLAVDSTRLLAVDVRPAVDVLLVDGEPREGAFRGEVEYLREAIDPRGRDEKRATSYSVRTLRDTEFAAADTDGVDFIALANVASLSGAQVKALERFVEGGGSVMIFLGDQVRIRDYNDALYLNGKGLLPASLGPTLGTTEVGHPEQYTTFDVGHFDHPALARFKAQQGAAGLSSVQVNKYFQLNLPVDDEAVQVILRFANAENSPAVVERRYGRGRVVLVATSADAEWTDFPKLPAYLQLMQEMMKYMMPDVLWRYNRLVDAETQLPVSAADINTSFVMEKPRHETVSLVPSDIGGQRRALVIGDRERAAPGAVLDQSGLYAIRPTRGGTGKEFRLAVNVDTVESELSHLDRDGLLRRLGGVPLVYARGAEGLKQSLLEQEAAGGWARNLLWAMLGLLLVETMLAWLFNRGA
ncbi:MAG: BatA domain-containing protein, partial [Planctomycetes bacterium]|nr:BatA domain-containing protein [Planctomycetota bacterium]